MKIDPNFRWRLENHKLNERRLGEINVYLRDRESIRGQGRDCGFSHHRSFLDERIDLAKYCGRLKPMICIYTN